MNQETRERYPQLRVDLGKLRENITCTVERCRAQGSNAVAAPMQQHARIKQQHRDTGAHHGRRKAREQHKANHRRHRAYARCAAAEKAFQKPVNHSADRRKVQP